MNAAQKLAERLGLPTSLPKHENGGYIGTARPKKFRQGKRRQFRLPGPGEACARTHADALLEAAVKFDMPIAQQPKPCNGVREGRREIRQRLNWLRSKTAEEQASE